MASTNKLKQAKAMRQLEIDHVDELLALAQSALIDDQFHVRFKLRCEHLEAIYDQFQKQHDTIILNLSISENPDVAEEKLIRTSFLDNYFTIKTIYSNLFTDNKCDNSIKTPNVKLPKISLPNFDGNYKNWLTFFDLFSSLIHDNNSLSDIEKFQYLLSSLSSHALTLLKGIPVTAQNYATAFKTLTDRYQNRRLLANSCWQAIYNAPKLTYESAAGLRQLLETFDENLAALKNLQLPVAHWDFVLFHILIQKVDAATIKRFELQEASTEIPSFSNFRNFLTKQCTALESVALSVSNQKLAKPPQTSFKTNSSSNNSRSVVPKFNSSFFTQSTRSIVCNYCKSPHSIYKCSAFFKKPPSDRLQIAQENNWCINCLHSGHRLTSCSSQSRCRVCTSKHHTLLHDSRDDSAVSANSDTKGQNNARNPSFRSQASPSSEITVAQVHSFTNVLPSKTVVLLSTAKIEILDAWGNYQSIRILVDGGSQANIISQRCIQKLGLHTSRISLSIFGLGQTSSSTSSGVVCTIRPLGKTFPSFTLDAVVLPKICNPMPNCTIPLGDWQHVSNLKLADPQFNIPGEIDMLIGADIFSKILRDGKISGHRNEPTAINTSFGWILMGQVSCALTKSAVNTFMTMIDSSLDFTLKRFWELEELPPTNSMSPEDILCEQYFVENHSRDSTGRYTVSLPFKVSDPSFGDSKTGALRRFYTLERRLLRDNNSLRSAYLDFMRDYLESGHMELATSPPSNCGQVFYIPHHSVINPNSSTSPLRVVFDASAQDADGNSLNDNLLIGPKLQKDVVTLLLHFRLHAFVFTADIKQMYRQINIHCKHRDYQRIFWRFSSDTPVQEYRLNTVTYGVSSAPFLALRTLQQLASDEIDNFPLAADVIRSDMYVDDIVTGCSTLSQALNLKDQLISVLEKGGFTLRKWASNSAAFLEPIPANLRQTQSFSFSDDNNNFLKILGLKWLPSSDVYIYSLETMDRPCTKRTILSEVARIFDPLGFLSPLTFFTKYLIQHLWILGLDWDQTPPSEVVDRWNQYKSELPCLLELKIPRRCVPDFFLKCQLHGFCDSSERGYGAVIYFRYLLPNNSILIYLICAKSKVSPLKRISIPRLELCAALLLSRLINFVVQAYSTKLPLTNNIFAWSDSSVALSWIKSSPHRFKSFVSNRVSQIQERVPPDRWFHVPSLDNPADCASRGLLASELVNHPLWFSGPPWLRLPSDSWPTTTVDILGNSFTLLEEERKIVLSNFVLLDSLDVLLDKWPSLSKIQRIICYCLRFIKNSRNPSCKSSSTFDAPELHEALLILVKHVQSLCFSDIISNLQRGKHIPKCFRKLSPFCGEDGVLRVGGRLTHSGLRYDQKHPALLPRKHRLTELIIEHIHKENLHPGLQTLHFLISQNFWILSPRRAIRHTLSKCLRCFRINPKPYQPPMGDLPPVRVSQVKPFSCVGVDFGGPFFITLGKSRGRCSTIFSDRGTNFVGANNELIELMKQATESEKILWSFNPPAGAHFGGIWEAGIKSVKSHLLRVIGDQILTYEEFYTVLVQIEALLNSRPLCPVSSDPHDFSVLTPGHFLTLEPLTSLPSSDLSNLKLNRLSRWQLIQRLQHDFWRRWHCEYLNTLQQRTKWLNSEFPVISPGTLVLIKNNLTAPLKWHLGRIEKIHPGKDGVCRVATLRTSHGLMQRPLVKLCPLPFSN